MSEPIASRESLLKQFNWRYAVKQFDPTKKVSDADWATLEQSLILAPTSFGLQPFKFVVVTDQKIKEELTPHAWNQPQVRDCSHLVVIAARQGLSVEDVDHYVERITQVTGAPREKLAGYEQMMKGFQQRAVGEGWVTFWTAKQGYIALGFILSAAAILGIDACPMEGFIPAEFDRILGLDKEGYSSTVLCAVGYRSADDHHAQSPKVRFEASELVKRV